MSDLTLYKNDIALLVTSLHERRARLRAEAINVVSDRLLDDIIEIDRLIYKLITRECQNLHPAQTLERSESSKAENSAL